MRETYSDVKTALNASHVVISITGPAAGQTEPEMRRRKLAELSSEARRIFWGIRSWTCCVGDVYNLVTANGSRPTFVLFFDGGSPTCVGRQPTEARFYAQMRDRPTSISPEWRPMPRGIHVWNVRTKNDMALVLGSYEVVDRPVKCDFSQYTFFNRVPSTVALQHGQTVPSLTGQGRSTVCAVKGGHGARPYLRRLVGIGKLVDENAVWVRA